MRSDGTTCNVPEYYWYGRETLTATANLDVRFWGWFAWSILVGAFSYFTSVITVGGILGPDGKTNDYWNVGVTVVFVNVTSHHILVLLSTRNFTWFLCLLYFISYAMFMPLTFLLNDLGWNGSQYDHNQFSVLLSSPLFWISSILQIFIVVSPRWLRKIHEDLVSHPEFSRISIS